jgi:hypothetical protein
MAGIRPQRGGAFTGVHIALVVFVVLWLVCTIGLVILYTGQTKVDQDREAAVKALDKVASSGELGQYGSLARPGQTILGRMAEDRRGMAKAIAGSEGDEWFSLKRQIDEKYTAINTAGRIENAKDFDAAAPMPLLKAVDLLASGLAQEGERRAQADAALKQAQAQITDLTQARDKAGQQFDQTVAGIASQLKDTQTQLADYQKSNEQVLETLKGNASKADEQLRKEADRHRAELEEQDKNLGKMRNRLNDALATLKQLRGQPDIYAGAKEIDGKIIRSLPGDPYVYVNLGAKDRITLGMTFSVYNASEAIPTSGEGKATIEITSIYDDVSAGKIISRKGSQPVLEGDVIANAIYSKNHKHKFLVLGRFDLDNSGTATAADADKIKAMIAEWGGEAISTVDTTTDFVVVGQGPVQPVPPPATASPIDKQRYQESVKAFEDFQGVLTEAKSLMVPILNQTQFLHFVGYNLNAMRAGKVQAAAPGK